MRTIITKRKSASVVGGEGSELGAFHCLHLDAGIETLDIRRDNLYLRSLITGVLDRFQSVTLGMRAIHVVT